MPLKLTVVSHHKDELGTDQVMEFRACGGTIGRSPSNDWVLSDDDRYLSGRHAIIDYQGGTYYIIDTSRNGVYVNASDTPVGQGHPQRLFDGDQLRMGEFQINVEIAGLEAEPPEDGMRDSVVRAQLVTEDESVEMPLMAAETITGGELLEEALSTADQTEHAQAVGTGSSGETSMSSMELASPVNREISEREAAELLLSAAGVDMTELAGLGPREILQTSGQLLRELVLGLMQLLKTRSRIKDDFRLSQTAIQQTGNNPLKFSPGADDALQLLFSDRGESYMPATEAVRDAVGDIEGHQKAIIRAMNQALTDYLERFDPDELRSRFDRGAKQGLLSGNARARYWQMYEEIYQALTHQAAGKPPHLFEEEFARAYEKEVGVPRTGTSG